MSWQAYIDTMLIEQGHLVQGAILSVAGDSVWASSPGLQLTAEEMKAFAGLLNDDEAITDHARANGVFVGGKKFTYLGIDDVGILYAKQGQEAGVVARKSKQAIVIGIHDKTLVAGNAKGPVLSLTTHLENSGY